MQIADRVSLWGGKKSPLPPGARWVEYLESTGTQHINLGFLRNDFPDMSIDVKFTKCSYVNNYVYNAGLIGWCEGSNGNATGVKISSDGILLRDARHSIGTTTLTGTPPVDIEGTLSYNGATINGTSVTDYTLSVSYSALYYPCGLFCFSSSETCTPKGYDTNRGIGKGRCHYIKVRSGNLVVRDFRPIAIGTTGYMLDLVSGEHLPYGNAGTGDFIVGPDAPAMTGGGYKRLCVKRSHRRSSQHSARFWRAAHLPRTWKEVA